MIDLSFLGKGIIPGKYINKKRGVHKRVVMSHSNGKLRALNMLKTTRQPPIRRLNTTNTSIQQSF